MIFKRFASRKRKASIFALGDCLFPKNPSKLVLVVKKGTEFSGNLRVANDIFVKEKKHKIYIYKDGKFIPEIKKNLENQGVTVLEGWSIVSIFHLLTSGIFVFSHAPRDAHITKRCRKRVIINLWHGAAFKNIESLMPNIAEEKQNQIQANANLYDHIIASSISDKKICAKAFMVDESKVHVTGLPRYDILKDTYTLDSFLKMQKEKLRAIKKNKKLILYAPTFRENNSSAIDQISNSDWDKLSHLLEQNQAIMAIRPHAYDEAFPSYIKNNKNFCFLSQQEYTEPNLVLQFTDILVVDFSSIWIDFLLLNRPIVGFAKDFDHYVQTERGFVYNFKETFPDTFYVSVNPLINHLEVLFSEGISSKEYKEATSLFHHYSLEAKFKSILHDSLKIHYIRDICYNITKIKGYI
jgi:CDP-glycerol glycerophosphotransferase (TagB/SpsB family)